MNTSPKQQAITSVALTLAMVASATLSTAQEWGSLSGRLVVDGSVGKPAAINVTKDTAYCGTQKLVQESIVVGEKGGLANAFVYLYLKRGKSVDVHPDLAAVSKEPVVLDNKGCRFEPHVLTMRTGQTLHVRNSDPGIGHNTNAQFLRNTKFNETVSNDSPLIKTFDKSESYPSPIACNVHPWMTAHILIRDNPYMAVTGKDGSFEIKNIPAGEHEFIFWQESVGNLKDLSLGPAGKTDRKGRAKLKIPAGSTLKLGDVKIKASILKK